MKHLMQSSNVYWIGIDPWSRSRIAMQVGSMAALDWISQWQGIRLKTRDLRHVNHSSLQLHESVSVSFHMKRILG